MIDLHCHIDLYPDPHAIVRLCRVREVFVVSVTTTPAAWHGSSALADTNERIHTALGLHPQLAGERESELGLFDSLIKNAPWVGEIGLDGSAELRGSWQSQTRVFAHILASCSRNGGRTMSIHSRRAAGRVLEALRENGNAGTPVLHWFSGTPRELRFAIDLGCWFSVGIPMLRSRKGRALVAQMPQERVLTESDGPFVELNEGAAHPWDVAIAEAELQQLWGIPYEDTRAVLDDNLARLLAITVKATADQ